MSTCTLAVLVTASVAGKAVYTATNCFSIKGYQLSAPFHNWDQKPTGVLVHSECCHRPQSYSSAVTCVASSKGLPESVTSKAWACCTTCLGAVNAFSTVSCQSQLALFLIRPYNGHVLGRAQTLYITPQGPHNPAIP